MSWCTCDRCSAYIDSDEDPDCFVEVGNMRRLHKTVILCAGCRDERERQEEALQALADQAQELGMYGGQP